MSKFLLCKSADALTILLPSSQFTLAKGPFLARHDSNYCWERICVWHHLSRQRSWSYTMQDSRSCSPSARGRKSNNFGYGHSNV